MKRSSGEKAEKNLCALVIVTILCAFLTGCGYTDDSEYDSSRGSDTKQKNTKIEDRIEEDSAAKDNATKDNGAKENASKENTAKESMEEQDGGSSSHGAGMEKKDISDILFPEEISGIDTSYNHYFYHVSSGGLNAVVTPEQVKYLAESSHTNNFDRRITVGEYIPVEVKLTDAELSRFESEVKKVEAVYQYEDLYFIENALAEAKKYDNEAPGYSKRICETSQIPTYEMLYDVISANSKEYLSTHPGLTALSEEQMETFVHLLYEDLVLYREHLSRESLERVYSGLTDIKLACIDSADFQLNDLKKPYNARVLEDFTFLFDFNNMKLLRGEQIAARTMDHEINHLFQRMCPEKQIAGYDQIGGSQYFIRFEEEHMPNSIHFQWLYEAAAEELVSDKYGLDPLVYQKMVGYLHSLDYVTMLTSRYDENAFELASLNTDRNSFYELLEAESETEKTEIRKMLYTIDFLQTTREDFVEQYVKQNPTGSYDYEQLKYEMKPAALTTLTKYFYRNLARLVNSNQGSLQDIFFLINVYEADLNAHLSYYEAEKYTFNEEFMNQYVKLQDRFFEALANSSSLSFEEIVKEFGSYSGAIVQDGVISRNCGLDFLDEEEKKFLYDELLTANIWAVNVNIRDCFAEH